MATIDLLALEPTVITRDLSNKYILLAAPYKFGKTTFMTNIPGALILSFEPGLNARAGVYAQKITSWSDLKQVTRQLAKPEVMAKFKCVCWDTIEIAATMCQEFICARAGVQNMGDVPYGKLYKEYELEFSKTIRSVAMLGYGCVFACHTEIKNIEVQSEVFIEQVRPKLDRRAFDIINGLVDIIVKAGNRFTYFPPVIEFSYQAVLENLSKAIEAEATINNATVVDQVTNTQEKLDYNLLRTEARVLWSKLVGEGDSVNEEMAARIQKRVEMIFGRPIKLSEITEDQVDLMHLVVLDMKELQAGL